MKTDSVRVYVHLSAEEFMAYYRGQAQAVVAIAEDGRRVAFPASRLRPYLDHGGVHGHFELRFDADHRLTTIRRVR